MDLAAQYAHQYAWRSWQQAYDALPFVSGARILDLGCAIGDQSHDLAALGALVVGIDADESLLASARSRMNSRATFQSGDVRDPLVDGPFDGIWASFVAAYFPNLSPVLGKWRSLLRPGGWIALTEVSGLLAHEPLSSDVRALLRTHACEARQAGRYDFDMGCKLEGHLSAAGFVVEVHQILPDRELSFAGAADPDVLQAWTDRLARMPLLRERARQANVPLQQDFLRCLGASAHTTGCRVHYCVARCPENVKAGQSERT
jgi:SAM-dependent methyltransferase